MRMKAKVHTHARKEITATFQNRKNHKNSTKNQAIVPLMLLLFPVFVHSRMNNEKKKKGKKMQITALDMNCSGGLSWQ